MRKNSRKMFIVLTAFAALYLPQSFAETLNAQATFVVHESDITQWINDQTAQWLVPNRVIANQVEIWAPYHSILRNISWQGAATFNWTKNPKTDMWVFDGQTNNITLYASDFEIHDSFPVTVNGQVIHVRVDAVCQNLTMSMPGVWKVHGQIPLLWPVNAQLVANVQNFSLTPSSQVPVLKIASCQGPTGMETFLNQQIAYIYGQPGKLQSAALGELQAFVNNQVAGLMSKMGKPVSFPVLGTNVSFTPTSGSNQPNGTILLDGPLTFQAPNGSGTKTVAKNYSDYNLSGAGSSGFAFSNSLLNEIVGWAYRAGLINIQFSSSDISAFQSFMQSRTEQFFIWQDLWNFATNTVFKFDLAASGTPSVPTLANLYPGVQMQVNGPIDAVMSAPTKYGYLPYVEFWSNSSPAGIQLNFTANKNGSLQVAYSANQLDLGYNYRKEFAKIRTPTMGINTDIIAQNVIQAEQNQSWNYTMPDSASPIPGYRLLFKDVLAGIKTFRINMSIQKK